MNKRFIVFLLFNLLVLNVFLNKPVLAKVGDDCCPDGYKYAECERYGQRWKGCSKDGTCSNQQFEQMTCDAATETCKIATGKCGLIYEKTGPCVASINPIGDIKVGDLFSVTASNLYPQKTYHLTAYDLNFKPYLSWNRTSDPKGNLRFEGSFISKIGTFTLKVVQGGVDDPNKADTCNVILVSVIPRDPDCSGGATWKQVGTTYCCAQWKLQQTIFQWVCDSSAKSYCANPSNQPVPDPNDKGKLVCLEYDPKDKQFDYNFSERINKCDNKTVGIQTALGCIPTEKFDGSKGFLSFVLRWVFGVSGGVILVMLLFTGYSLLTSAGNPEKLQAVKENLVSLFAGLILIVFSLILLQTIGMDILKLPTFVGP